MPDNLTSTEILSADDIAKKVRLLAYEILDGCGNQKKLAFVGVYTRGVTLARRVKEILKDELPDVPLGSVDISLYRDDLDNLGTTPTLKNTDIPFELEGAHVVLFDEVIFTGRTVRAAVDSLMDFGRPSKIELAVLVDRGNRELPIQPDYVSVILDTTMDEYVKVRFVEDDDQEGVFLLQ